MLPTIVGLNAVKLAQLSANDAGRPLVARNEKGRFVPLAQATANDRLDTYQTTMDRIMARHNGHDRTIPRAANAPDPYETTMDRIMQRHNGHDRIIPEPANDLKNRIFHEPQGPLAQAQPRDMRNWEPYEEKPLLLSKKYVPEDDDLTENETGSPSKKRKRASEYLLLKKIEKNTDKCTKLLEEIRDIEKDRDDGMGVDNLRAQEMAKEDWQGNYPSSSKSSSGMALEGKEKGGESKLEALWNLKGQVLGAGAAIGIGWIGKKIAEWMGVTPDNPGGGHTSEKQRPGNRANNNNLPNNAPAPAPRPDVLTPQGAPTGVSDKTAPGTGYRPASKIPPKVANDKAFQAEVTRVAKKYNLAEDDLYRVMSFESGGTFSPSQKNAAGSGATGLIQFMPKTAKGLGTSTAELARMSRAEQMQYVDKYFAQNRLNKAKNPTIDDLYMTIFKPKMVGAGADAVHSRLGSREYKQNRGQDINRDGVITQAEITQKVRDHDMLGIGTYRKPGPLQAAPAPKSADHQEWRMDDKQKTQKAMQQFSATRGKAQKMKDGSTVTNHGNRSTVVLAPAKKADAATEALAARIAADKKRGVPPAKSESWGEWAKRYFTWD